MKSLTPGACTDGCHTQLNTIYLMNSFIYLLNWHALLLIRCRSVPCSSLFVSHILIHNTRYLSLTDCHHRLIQASPPCDPAHDCVSSRCPRREVESLECPLLAVCTSSQYWRRANISWPTVQPWNWARREMLQSWSATNKSLKYISGKQAYWYLQQTLIYISALICI